MDQIKIGKFIAERRKEKKLTQMQLAEKLGITDRAVSKWETGKTMPDSSLMLELCNVLDITVNDLLNGEAVSAENYTKKMEERLLEVVAEREQTGKRFAWSTLFLYICIAMLYLCVCILSQPELATENVCFTVSCIAAAVILFSFFIMLKVQQYIGYHRCGNCGHTYVPTVGRLLCSRATKKKFERKIRCPKCGKRNWHTLVYTKPSE